MGCFYGVVVSRTPAAPKDGQREMTAEMNLMNSSLMNRASWELSNDTHIPIPQNIGWSTMRWGTFLELNSTRISSYQFWDVPTWSSLWGRKKHFWAYQSRVRGLWALEGWRLSDSVPGTLLFTPFQEFKKHLQDQLTNKVESLVLMKDVFNLSSSSRYWRLQYQRQEPCRRWSNGTFELWCIKCAFQWKFPPGTSIMTSYYVIWIIILSANKTQAPWVLITTFPSVPESH